MGRTTRRRGKTVELLACIIIRTVVGEKTRSEPNDAPEKKLSNRTCNLARSTDYTPHLKRKRRPSRGGSARRYMLLPSPEREQQDHRDLSRHFRRGLEIIHDFNITQTKWEIRPNRSARSCMYTETAVPNATTLSWSSPVYPLATQTPNNEPKFPDLRGAASTSFT